MANPPGIVNTDMKMTSPPSAPSSVHTSSFSDTSSPLSQTPPAKHSPAIISSSRSPQTNCGNSPAFGLYMPHSDFGGLGGLGLSAVLAAHSQFGTIPEPWMLPEAHSTGQAAFFSPLLGGIPVFTQTFKSQDDAFSQMTGFNGTVNGTHALFPNGKVAVNTSPFATKGNQGKIKALTKDNHPQKRTLEAASMSGRQSGFLSENSTDGEDSSSDDDMEEEDNDDSGDEDDPSDESDASDSDKDTSFNRKLLRLTHNTSDTKKKRPCTSDGYTARDSETVTAQQNPDDVPLTSSHRLQASTHPAGPPLSTAVSLCSPMPSEEQHISVIQAPGSTANVKPKGQAHMEDFWSSLKSISSTNHLKTSLKLLSHSVSSVKPLSLCSSPEPSPLPLPKSPLHSTLPMSPALFVTQSPPHKARQLMSPAKSIHEASNKRNNGKLVKVLYADSSALRESLSTLNASSTTQDWYTSHKNSASQSPLSLTSPNPSSLNRHLLPSANRTDASVFLNHHTNGLIHSDVQEAPLALVTKQRDESNSPTATRPHFQMPVNLSTGSKEARSKTTIAKAKCLANVNVESECDKHKNEGSDDSLEDDNNDGDDTEDSDSSLSESESNLEPGSEEDIKETNSDARRTPLKLAKAYLSHKSSSSISANSSLLNTMVLKPPCPPSSLGSTTAMTSLEALRNPNNTAPFTFVPLPGQRKRLKDEEALRLPLEFGWQRVTRMRTVAGRLQGEVCYYAPCGKKLRQYPDVMKYLLRNGINEISRDNFSFSTKIKLGDFYESREGPEGSQWVLLTDEEIAPCIIAMDGRRSRQRKAQCQPAADGTEAKSHPHLQDVTDAKLLRKLEAQEIARQATQIKMIRKLEKQAMAQAAKEAKKQQAILAAEERRKKKEQMKIIKQQEKIKRIQQIRLEKEVRAQQILEAKRKKKEAAANAKILEAEKRSKERELRRLHALLLKHQEMEMHRLDIVWEKERRKQHVMLMKAVEARKKAEEKERLRKEKKDEKRLNKERKLELRRLELEKAKELKTPKEDLCLTDHKPLPELSRIPGLELSGSTFSDCLMVLQFVHSFGKVLGLNINALGLSELQKGLLNVGDSVDRVQDLLVGLVSAAVCDPSLLQGQRNKTALGEHLANVELNRDNVSEVLRIYMESYCEQSDLAALALSLRTKDFRAHRPSDKASLLAFLVNELCCCKAVVSEIDKNIDHINNLRKEKWIVEGKLRKLRSIHAKKTGKRDITVGEDTPTCVYPTARNKSKRKEGDSEEEDDEDEESEDRDEEEDVEDYEGKKAKKAFEDEEDCIGSASVEELEKQIEKVSKQQNEIRQKILELSHCLRSVMIGQDRYKRCYWFLPQCGGIFVEGMGTREGHEDVPKEQKQNSAHVKWVKEEQLSKMRGKVVPNPALSTEEVTATLQSQQDKPVSFCNLSKLLEEAKMIQIPVKNVHMSHRNLPASPFYDFCPPSDQGEHQSTNPGTSLLAITDKSHKPSLLNLSPASSHHHNNVSTMLVEKSHPWFSLLPRSPCDESSVTSASIPSLSFSQIIKTSYFSFSANTAASSGNPTAVNNMHMSVQQVG